LQDYVATWHPDLVNQLHVRVFHQMLEDFLQSADQAPVKPLGDQNAYWTRELPAAFADNLESLGYPDKYDYLVMDEGQDLLQTEYLMCLEPLLKNGFDTGQWLVVYDPNQNLYNIQFQDGLDYLLNCRPARFSLTSNCRNTKQIIEFTARATKIDSKQELQADGPGVKSIPFKDSAEQQRLLAKEVQKMLSQNIKPRDICILSARTLKNSGLGGNTVIAKGTNLQDIGGLAPAQWDERSIRFSTLYRFKGLESPVIVLIDVHSFADEQDRIRNYTAMTRAKSILYVFHSEAAAGLDQIQ
jgi:superfamily I DNA and RNA helicase